MCNRHEKRQALSAVVAIVGMLSLSGAQLLATASPGVGVTMPQAQRQHRSAGGAPARVTAEQFNAAREQILHLKAGRAPSSVVVRLQRLVALTDAMALPSVEAKRQALAGMGITVSRRVSNGEVISTAMLRGVERPLWRGPVVPNYTDSVPRAGGEQPDGSVEPTGASARLLDPETLQDAEDFTDVHMAMADAVEYENLALAAELEQYTESPDPAVCAEIAALEMPDGAGAPAISDTDCIDNLVNSIMNAAGSAAAALGFKDGLSSSIATLRLLVAGHSAAYAAGTISYGVMVDMVAGAVGSFIGSMSLGWVAVGVLAAGALYFAYKWYQCQYPIEPEAQHTIAAPMMA
jgi:hypothetical protein